LIVIGEAENVVSQNVRLLLKDPVTTTRRCDN